MTIPYEFTPEGVEAQSAEPFTPYRDFLRSREPYTSLLARNPWLRPPAGDKPLEWGKGWYYDTTVARKHEYWRQFDLPRPTKDLVQMRRDLYEWGYCLIDEGLSARQCAAMQQRVAEQAEAERIAGIAQMSPSFQIVWFLINKGDVFVRALEHDPVAVQAGPVIERLVDEALGKGWYCYSFVSNIAFPGCHPQGLHQDQGAIHPWQTPEAPILINTMYILQDVDEVNGGTLIIPGSHKTLAEAGSGKPIGELPPAINVEAKAGTVLVFDGRMLHGTGANRSDAWRYVMTQSNVKVWLRQQENWMLGVRPEVLNNASPELLQRMGFQATAGYGLTEGHGMSGNGRAGDVRGNLRGFRQAADTGTYRRVGELTPETARQLAQDTFTLQEVLATYPNE